MQKKETRKTYIKLMNGRITVLRCQALSKRSKEQCRKAALKGKRVCMFHGGKSTGPITSLGRKRCADAKTIHGRETRTIRIKHSQKLRELKFLFEFIK